jgi:hypothetical protein
VLGEGTGVLLGDTVGVPAKSVVGAIVGAEFGFVGSSKSGGALHIQSH